jgi:sporulation protein YlmC with PRC-barrel domain
MPEDITSAVFKLLGPAVIGRIASALGREPAAIEKSVAAAVPAILSGMGSLVSTPEGARRLENVINWELTETGDAVDVVRGSERGKSILTTLFGYTAFTELVSSVARFGDIGVGASRSLLGMITPVIMSALGEVQRNAGVGAAGLAQMLSAQLGEISASMPPAFSEMLESSGFFDGIDSVVSSGARTSTQASAPQAGARDAGDRNGGSSVSPSSSWLYWAVPLVAFAVLAWYLLPGWEQGAQLDEGTRPTAVGSGGSAPETIVATDLAHDTVAAINSLDGSLLEIKDVQSAKLALPKFEHVADELDRVTAVLDKLPPEGRRTVANLTDAAIAKLRAGLDSAAKVPGAAGAVAPAIAAVRSRLDTFSAKAGGVLAERVAKPEATAATPAGYLPKASPDSVSVSAVYVGEVFNRNGEKLGTVNDLLVDQSGKVSAAIIGVGQFLGIGEKEVAVPFSLVTIVRHENGVRIVIDGTKDSLHSAPPFEATLVRVRLKPATP